MKNIHRSFVLISLIAIVGCSDSHYYYQPQAVDLAVEPHGETFKVSGSSVLQARDTFVWGGSPIQIDKKYYLMYSVLYSRIS